MLHKGHFLVCGVTRSGKGMLMRRIAQEYRRRGVKVFLYTPRKDEYIDFDGLADFRTQSADRFFEETKRAAESGIGGICAIVDEAMSFDRNKLVEMMNQFAAYGVEMWLQVQRAKMVPPNIRFAAENCIAFRQFVYSLHLNQTPYNYVGSTTTACHVFFCDCDYIIVSSECCTSYTTSVFTT